MADKWLYINEMYEKAEKLLWENSPAPRYRFDRDKVKIYLYSAYYSASREIRKNHLLYARILLMMYEEKHGRYNEYSIFHCFLKRAFEEYILAAESGNEQPEKAETDRVLLMYKKSKQYAEMYGSRKYPRKGFTEIIGGIPLPDDFEFRDCTIVSFRHDTDSALLELKHSDTVAALKFTGIYELSAELIPSASWVADVSCSRCAESGTVSFDIGYYKILCADIEVIDIKS